MTEHNQGIIKLVNRLSNKPYVKAINYNVEDEFAKLDVCSYQDTRYCFYKYEVNHTDGNFNKAKKQCKKWTESMHKQYPTINFYGIYVSSNKSLIISRN